jgi:hypothetical protein
MSENMGALTSRKPKAIHGLYRDNFFFSNMHQWAETDFKNRVELDIDSMAILNYMLGILD